MHFCLERDAGSSPHVAGAAGGGYAPATSCIRTSIEVLMKRRAPLRCLTAALAVTALGLGGLVPAAAAPEPSSGAANPAVGAVPETAPPDASQALAVEAADSAADQPLGPFYVAPSQLPDSPASLLKHEASPFYLGPARAVRLGEAQSRIMYTTTDSDGAIVPVMGSFLESGSP
ncbi:MAG: hypothetical protein LBE67_03300 [Kocuria palustris]|jgi:hypothetical protein|nr:hypothetical protein [Kocuria palustris]